MTAPDRFTRGTGKSLAEWMRLLQPESGSFEDLSHREIADSAREQGASPWWAQGIAVEIERSIGRRKVGHTSTGSISVSASGTVPGEWTSIFDRFVVFLYDNRDRLPGEPASEPKTSETEKWRYWKMRFADGSRVTLNCQDATKGEQRRTALSFGHDLLPDLELREPVKEQWRSLLQEFSSALSKDQQA